MTDNYDNAYDLQVFRFRSGNPIMASVLLGHVAHENESLTDASIQLVVSTIDCLKNSDYIQTTDSECTWRTSTFGL